MFNSAWIRSTKLIGVGIAFAMVFGVVIATHALAADVVQLRWDFEEGSGATATDSSGNSNSGTLYNGASYVPGHSGLGASLDGIDQYVQSNSPIASLGTSNTPYALSAWVRVPTGVTDGNIVHVSSNANGGNWCIPFLRLQGGVFRATGWDGNSVSAVGTTTVVPDQWYQVLTTWDPGNGLRLFVNGTLEDSSPQASFSAYGSPVYVSVGLSNGTCSEDQGFLRGTVDDVRVYDRALNAADITAINNPNAVPSNTTTAVSNTAAPTTFIPGAPNTGAPRAATVNPVLWWVSVGAALALALYALMVLVRRVYSRR